MPAAPGDSCRIDDQHLIRAIPEDFVRYYDARDVNMLLTLFSDDGRVLAPFRPAGEGKMGLRDLFQTSFAQFDPKNLKLVTIYVEVCGYVAYGYGSYLMNIKLPNGRRMEDHGKWMASLRRTGTTWKMVAQCWNTDLPLTAFGK
jgi:ketosteroid isomerase-like protein